LERRDTHIIFGASFRGAFLWKNKLKQGEDNEIEKPNESNSKDNPDYHGFGRIAGIAIRL
jgi:hypothetical protein